MITTAKIFLYIMPLFIPIGSCFREVQNGYPKCVEFSAEGGSQIISGDVSLGHVEILDGNKTVAYSPPTSEPINISYEWLTLEKDKWDTSMVLTAKPNKTGKKRKLKIQGTNCYEHTYISIVQHP